MESTVSQLKLLLSQYSKSRSRKNGYPPNIKELCLRLAKSIGVHRASQQSGISQGCIYNWIKKNENSRPKTLASSSTKDNRPMVLQEINLSSVTPPPPKITEIKLVSPTGVIAHLPLDRETLALVIDRMMENRI